MRHVHIVSSRVGSIGEITNDLIDHFADHFHTTVEYEKLPAERDILFCHFINPVVTSAKNFSAFKKKVLIQPIDGTEIHQEFVERINQYDLVITPGQAGKTIMQDSGVTVPIEVIPNYYKEDLAELSQDCDIKDIPKDKIVFYHESTFHPRKGIEVMYEAYIRAFSDTPYADKVLLVVKDMRYNKLTFDRIEKSKREMMKLQKQFKNPARIVKISQRLEWKTLKKLWKRADAYISLASMEGFGIPLLRFAVLGKPIITLNAPKSGYVDYLNDDNSYLIPTTQKVANGEHMNMYTEKTEWAYPEVSGVVEQLQKCYDDLVKVKPKLVDQKVTQQMNYENVMKKYVHLLKEL